MWKALVFAITLNSLQTDDFKKLWDETQKAISTRFYARVSRKAELERLIAKYRPRAEESKTREQFAEAVNEMIDEFKDSHFAFFTKEMQGYFLMDGLLRKDGGEMPTFGAWLSANPSGDGYTVRMVLDGSEAAKSGLRKGDVITRIDTEAFTPVTSLLSRVGKSSVLTYHRRGIESSVAVQIESKPVLKMFLDATRESAKIINYKGKKIGYVHLWAQANTDFRDTLASIIYGKLRETDALILDNRDGFGGRPEGYLDPLFRPNVIIEWKFLENGPALEQLFGYGAPVAMLINEGSRSAKEVTAQILKTSKRGTVIGSKSAGHVLGTSPIRLNDWAILEIPIVDVIVDGTRLEGNGVEPDILLATEIDSEGKDLHIDTALETLYRKLQK